jgi:PKD repeat protein
MDGTSMSCPHVVGVVGLLESYDPTLTAQDKWDLIMNNSKPYNQTKYVGVGIIDARACLDAIGGGCDVAADFSGSPTSGCVPVTVTFTDASTGPVTSWDWDFGDGTGTSTAQNPSYQYTSPGNYSVSLTVTSATCNDTETKTAYIAVSDVVTANFSGTPTTGTAPLTVNFTDLSTGNPTAWSWDFGDGVGTSTATNPSYTYTSEGTYTVSLTASNGCGSDGETKTGYIDVDPGVENSMHVSAIAVSRSGNNQKSGVAQVTIVDQNSNPVVGAVVSGYFNSPNTNTKSGTTGTTGVATVISDRTKVYPSDWCFTVTNVVFTGYTYNSAANVVTEACESGPVYGSNAISIGMMPEGFRIGNYPNPFNPATTIVFNLPFASDAKLEVYNILGQRVATLVDEHLNSGEYSFEWDGRNVASGIYLYRLTTNEFSTTKQMVLMK